MAANSARRPKRWDIAFAEELESAEMSEELATRLLDSQFSSLFRDSARFPQSLSLLGIIMNDCRIRVFEKGEVVVRENDYGSSAFIILDGSVLVSSGVLSANILGRREQKKATLWNGLKTLLSARTKYPEIRNSHHTPRNLGDKPVAIQLQDFPSLLTPQKNGTSPSVGIEIEKGELFGEIAALGRSARTATVLASPKGTRLLEIRWQGLRDIRKYSPRWQTMIEERYRKNSLQHHLENTFPTNCLSIEKVLQDPDGASALISAFELVSRSTQFQTFGEYDWYGSYREVVSADPGQRIQKEPLIAGEGDHPAGLYIVQSGFARVSIKYNKGEKTLAYIGKGSTFGLAELYAHWKTRDTQKTDRLPPPQTLEASLRAIGYAELLFIPAPVVEKYVFPKLSSRDLPALRYPQPPCGSGFPEEKVTEEDNVLEFLVQERAINGTSAMLIDLDLCTRCDDCVRACASSHDGNPRFIRHGEQEKGIQLVHACMHCVDPLCMIGCPTGAIHRDQTGNQIVINDYTCIGCSTCANNCPYDNIQMTEVRFPNGHPYPGIKYPKESLAPFRVESENDFVKKATKCDLCENLPAGPACERACPHAALARVDLSVARPR